MLHGKGGNHGNKQSSWHLNESTQGSVTIDVGSLFQTLATRTKKHEFL